MPLDAPRKSTCPPSVMWTPVVHGLPKLCPVCAVPQANVIKKPPTLYRRLDTNAIDAVVPTDWNGPGMV